MKTKTSRCRHGMPIKYACPQCAPRERPQASKPSICAECGIRPETPGRGECADCHAPAAFKKNGKRARLCDSCLKIDRERATAEREAVRAETASAP